MYEQYLNTVRRLDVDAYRVGGLNQELIIARSGDLSVEYAPFDYIERGAELAIVGLTPGRTQATNALQKFGDELRKGVAQDIALRTAKKVASFSGPMRANLLGMLDAIGLPAVFGRSESAEFFSEHSRLVHFTSALRHPVYISGKNYSGSPNPLSEPLLRRIIEAHLLEEVLALPGAVWVPLGKHAEGALVYLSKAGYLRRDRVLAGLPHPSGANAERIAYFLSRKLAKDLSAKTNAAKLDELRTRLTKQVAQLQA